MKEDHIYLRRFWEDYDTKFIKKKNLSNYLSEDEMIVNYQNQIYFSLFGDLK